MNDNLGILQEPKLLLLTTSAADVLAMASGVKETNTVTLATFCNEDSTDRTVTLYRTENVTDYVIHIGTVGAGQSLEVPMQQKMMAKSTARKIRAKASAASVVTLSLTYHQSGQ